MAYLLLLLCSVPAHAVTRGLFEGVWASSTSFLVSTQTQKATVGNGGLCFAIDGTCMTTAGVGSSTVAVNASMSGDGSSATPLGVKSSSVAVLNSSGFVLSSEIDPSTVPKLNSSGKIPSSFLTGITSTCASGFHLSSPTVTNGLLTGGGCIADGSGSAGGHNYSTTTNSNTGPFVAQTARSSMTAAWPLVFTDSATADTSVLSLANYAYVASTVVYPVGTTAATSFAGCNISGSTATITTGNNPVFACFNGSGNSGASNGYKVWMLIDGNFFPGFTSSKYMSAGIANGNSDVNLSFCGLTNALTAGSHNICLAAVTSANTLSIGTGGIGTQGATLTAIELATGGNGYAAPASTTVYPNGSSAQTTLTTCLAASTATLTTGGGPVHICFGGGLRSSALSRVALAPIVDGGYLTGFTSVKGVLMDVFGADNNIDASFCVNTAALSAGTHNVCLTGAVLDGSGATFAIPAEGGTPTSIAQMDVTEIRNAPGTGDVSSNGTNNFTGSNTFTTMTVTGSLSVGESSAPVNARFSVRASTSNSAADYVLAVSSANGAAMFSVLGNGHLEARGAAPAVSSCGTSPSMVANSNDTAGEMQTGTGVFSSCTLTFSSSYPIAPVCFCVDQTTALGLRATTTTTTLVCAGTFTASDVVAYACIGRK